MYENFCNQDLWSNTVVVFLSDNGPNPRVGSAYPLRGSKNSLWEGGIRVPAFITGGYKSNQIRNVKSNEITHITDWFPTLCFLADIDCSEFRFFFVIFFFHLRLLKILCIV